MMRWILLLLLLLELATTVDSFSPLVTTPRQQCTHLAEASIPNQQNIVVTASVPNRFSRVDGLAMVDTSLFPTHKYGDRIRHGRDAQGLEASTVINGDDPIMELTYGEFPPQSTDLLIDLALPHVMMQNHNSPLEMIDLGSGCARLVCYFALTRGTSRTPWAVHGIEISNILHNVGVGALATGWEESLFTVEDESSSTMQQRNALSLHMGPADEFKDVLGKAHLIFAYSTVWKTDGFSQELSAMILDREWSELLASSCQKGCVVVTTDRALDPRHGWELLDRLDVDNREVMGSTGFLQVLR
jgi:hypothetical protein